MKDKGTTAAMILFEGVKLIDKRPDDMDFEDYKKIRKHQKLILKKILK